ncbi:ABC transporter substrate-binding protein [Saccharomonospora xinjiangensis]|uniref:ABC transporter substrate-binding protein n=1 Tax=Saccharomonospora xinjiangensis TaxID=75294 RepID=UPI003510705B
MTTSLTFLTDQTSPSMSDLAERVVSLWARKRPDVPVRLSYLDHEEMRDRLESLLTDPAPPDVMTWFAGNRMTSLLDRGLMLDISAIWRAEGFQEAYAPRFRDMSGGMGKSYFLPTSHYWWAVYYRPSVFAALGINSPVRTWSDLVAAAERLKAAGIAPFALGSKYRCAAAAWFDYLDMRLNGPAFHVDLMAMRVPYTDARVRRVFDFWAELFQQEWFLGTPNSYDEEEAAAAVLRGDAGMTLVGAYVTDEFVPAGDSDVDFFRFPVIDPALPIGEDTPVDGYFAAGGGRAPDLARAFLAHLGSREVQELTTRHLTALPARTDVDVSVGGAYVARGRELIRGADHLGQFYDLDTPWELADAGMSAMVSFMDHQGDVAALLAPVEDKRNLLRAALS